MKIQFSLSSDGLQWSTLSNLASSVFGGLGSIKRVEWGAIVLNALTRSIETIFCKTRSESGVEEMEEEEDLGLLEVHICYGGNL